MKRNSSPKAKILELASFYAHEDTRLEVRSTRIKGDFHVEVAIYGPHRTRQVLARANHRNWRTAYKLLGIELSRRVVA